MIGKCNCGSVSFELKQGVPSLYHCHCTLCQKQAGTGSNAATIVPADEFAWLTGEDKIEKWHNDAKFSSHFCGCCGSPTPNVFQDKYVWIPIGLLENVKSKPVVNLWLSSKPEWANPNKLDRNYDTAPEDIEEFVEYLNSEKYL